MLERTVTMYHRRLAALVSFLLIFDLPGPGGLEARAAEDTPQYNPPWNQTRERIPQELKDKENETPIGWCDNKDKKEFEVTYFDSKTGTRTTIKRKERWSEPGPPPGQLGIVSGIRFPKSVWEITIDEPGKPRKKITYDLDVYKGETRTEKTGNDRPTSGPVKEGDLFDPTKVKKGSLFELFSPHQRASVNFSAPGLGVPPPGSPFSHHSDALLFAATSERGRDAAEQTQERPVINIKIVTYGNPPSETVVHFDPGPQTTPEEFMNIPTTGIPWDPERDGDGPKTVPLNGNTGIPITEIPGGGLPVAQPQPFPKHLGDNQLSLARERFGCHLPS